jgi:hypothetical protein
MQPGTKKFRYGDDAFALLCRRVEPFQGKLGTHYIYTRVRAQPGLQVFMKNHVFAVWDFMTLVKTLQAQLTCITTPWLPPSNPLAARLINEIVLGEETDEVGEGEYLSHYVLYLRAMGEIGADPGPMLRFEQALRSGQTVEEALAPLDICDATKSFVLNTMRTAQGKTHEVAASLLLAREDLIPVMFDRVVREMDGRTEASARLARAGRELRERAPSRLRGLLPGTVRDNWKRYDDDHPDPRANFRLYLQRHVHLDGEEHGPMGRRMLLELCGDDATKWEEATLAARAALEARIALWDGVLLAIERSRHGEDDRVSAGETWGGRDLVAWLDDQRSQAADAVRA